MVIMTFTLSSPSISPTGAAALITTRTGVSTAWEAAPATAGPNMKFFYCLAMLLVCLSSQLFVTNSTHQCLSHNRIVIYQIACDRREYLFVMSFRFPHVVKAEASAWTIKPIGYCMADG